MPDHRRHRGAHPRDRDLFSERHLPALRAAVSDFSFLLGRGYAERSGLALVGNRYQLVDRQRLAVLRSSCSDAARARRHAHRVNEANAAGGCLDVDGYNVLITVETALSGGVVLRARDGALRDLASLHGTYRTVEETIPAFDAVADTLARYSFAPVRWYFDAPVSNSGRLAGLVREIAAARGLRWDVELAKDPDRHLERSPHVVASADSRVLDRCARGWLDLAGRTVGERVPHAWVIALDAD